MIVDLDVLISVLFIIQAGLYLACAGTILRRRGGQESAANFFLTYALTAALMSLLEAAARLGWLPVLDARLLGYLRWFEALLLAGIFIFLVRHFLDLPGSSPWVFVDIFWLVLLVVIFSGILPLPETPWKGGAPALTPDSLRLGVIVLGWVVFTVGAILSVVRVYRQLRQPLHKNRLAYLTPVFLLLVANDVLIFLDVRLLGEVPRLGAILVLAYVMTRVHLPDGRQVLRQALSIAAAFGLIIGGYFGGFSLLEWLKATALPVPPLLLGLGITLLIAVLGMALYNFLRSLIYGLLPIEGYNPSVTLRDYALSISNIIDVERLATVAIGLIIEAMDIRRGFLLLVDKETSLDGATLFRLKPVRGAGEQPSRSGTLNLNSPIVLFFLQNRRPLLQYELDFQSIFRQAPANEREWLRSLEVEVYVPIYAKNEWIGMLALGAKSSGRRYTDDDLNVLTTLAHQTAVALENARLVDNLMRLNREIRQAYQALDNANRSLEHLDQTKSNFISIASHELRTPLTVLRGYTEMLLDDPDIKKNPYHLKNIEGIHKGTIRLHEIMDSMFDIAQIDTRSIELHMQSVNVAELIQSVCSGLMKSVQDRKQTLSLDFESLPTIKADPKTLKKVFYHLISNAIKFTPNGGKIGVLGSSVPPNQRDLPEGGVEIIVADTGVGVNPEFRELIFTKFYQPEDDLNKHSTGKDKFRGSGSGLGLALSRGIVEAHGGRIWVESPGYDEVNFPGSQFHVVLPLRRQGESDTVRISSAVKLKL